MDIVINISEDTYKRHKWRVDHDTCTELDIAVAKGTPLPKGHGRLIDADSLDIPVNIRDGFEAMAYIEGVDTIIEADRSVE